MKQLFFVGLLTYGIITIVYLSIYGQEEMAVNFTAMNNKNGTWSNPTGKYLVSQHAMVVCSTFISASLLLYNLNPQTEKGWQITVFAIWCMIDLLLVIVSYVFCIIVFSDMCEKGRCLKSYTPLYWLMWIEFVPGSIVFSGMVVAVIYIFCPCLHNYCNPLFEKYWRKVERCCGYRPELLADPVEVQGTRQNVIVMPVNFHYQVDDTKRPEEVVI